MAKHNDNENERDMSLVILFKETSASPTKRSSRAGTSGDISAMLGYNVPHISCSGTTSPSYTTNATSNELPTQTEIHASSSPRPAKKKRKKRGPYRKTTVKDDNIDNDNNNSDSNNEGGGEEERGDDDKTTRAKHGTHIFKKSSPHYKTLIELCKRKRWGDRLPTSKNDPDLDSFMKTTGFSRAQVARKFYEYQRSRWLHKGQPKQQQQPQPQLLEQGALFDDDDRDNDDDDDEKDVGQPFDNANQDDSSKQTTNKRKQAMSALSNKRAKVGQDDEDDTKNNDEPFMVQLPPINPADFLQTFGYSQQPGSNIASNNASAGIFGTGTFPYPTSPTKRNQSTYSEASPLRTRNFCAISPAPTLKAGALMLERNLSWANSHRSTSTGDTNNNYLPPPSLNRIQTAEMENLLRGQLIEPSHSSHQQQSMNNYYFSQPHDGQQQNQATMNTWCYHPSFPPGNAQRNFSINLSLGSSMSCSSYDSIFDGNTLAPSINMTSIHNSNIFRGGGGQNPPELNNYFSTSAAPTADQASKLAYDASMIGQQLSPSTPFLPPQRRRNSFVNHFPMGPPNMGAELSSSQEGAPTATLGSGSELDHGLSPNNKTKDKVNNKENHGNNLSPFE